MTLGQVNSSYVLTSYCLEKCEVIVDLGEVPNSNLCIACKMEPITAYWGRIVIIVTCECVFVCFFLVYRIWRKTQTRWWQWCRKLVSFVLVIIKEQYNYWHVIYHFNHNFHNHVFIHASHWNNKNKYIWNFHEKHEDRCDKATTPLYCAEIKFVIWPGKWLCFLGRTCCHVPTYFSDCTYVPLRTAW